MIPEQKTTRLTTALVLIASVYLVLGSVPLLAQDSAPDTKQYSDRDAAQESRQDATRPDEQHQSSAQARFQTPQAAMSALISAATAKDRGALADIFGAEYQAEMFSGDMVQDNEELDEFAADVQESAKIEKVNDDRFTLFIGQENWPFPMPIVKEDDQWRFDSAAGQDELLNRRIGQNELSTILTCRAYVLAQQEYYDQQQENSQNQDVPSEYAQRFMSSPGRRDGLYWDTQEGERPSPLGILVAAARAEGYGAASHNADANTTDMQNASAENYQTADQYQDTPPPAPVRSRNPYHGYYFKILTRQGPGAAGGARDYLVNGHMQDGFALIAFPDRWGSSGVMAFMVNQQGDVYEKNLGPDTAEIAGAIDEYNPDPTWKLVQQ